MTDVQRTQEAQQAGHRPSLRQSMAGLHLWAGLLAGWLLYAIFITGGVSFFRDELTQWLRPEIPPRPAVLDQAKAATRALATLQRMSGNADQWQIDLPGPRSNVIDAIWESGQRYQRILINPADGAPLSVRATEAGEFFYYLHFSLHYLPRTLGRWIVGLCAMMALVVLVSGIIVHRRIFSDFFTFRPGKGQRSWLDAHNSASVLGLPFHLMIVYTGLVTLMFTYMPWGALIAFGSQQARPALAQVMQARFDSPARSGVATPLANVVPLIAQADARWGKDSVGRIIVAQPGDAVARIAIVRNDRHRLSVSPAWLLFDGTNGALLSVHDAPGAAITAWGTIYALHLGRFADAYLRWMYFACSMLGAAMVATGMLLWNVKRRQKKSISTALMERGNVACIAGLLMAMPTFFLANRLLPLEMAQRAQWEVNCFFLCWGAALLHAACRPVVRSWKEQWLCGAILWVVLPIVDMWSTSRTQVSELRSMDTLFFSFDIAFLCTGLLCYLCRKRQ